MKQTIWYKKVFSQRKRVFLGTEIFMDNNENHPEYKRYTVDFTPEQVDRAARMLKHVADTDGVSFIEMQLADFIYHILGIKPHVFHTGEWKTRIGEYKV